MIGKATLLTVLMIVISAALLKAHGASIDNFKPGEVYMVEITIPNQMCSGVFGGFYGNATNPTRNTNYCKQGGLLSGHAFYFNDNAKNMRQLAALYQGLVFGKFLPKLPWWMADFGARLKNGQTTTFPNYNHSRSIVPLRAIAHYIGLTRYKLKSSDPRQHVSFLVNQVAIPWTQSSDLFTRRCGLFLVYLAFELLRSLELGMRHVYRAR